MAKAYTCIYSYETLYFVWVFEYYGIFKPRCAVGHWFCTTMNDESIRVDVKITGEKQKIEASDRPLLQGRSI